VIGEATVPQRRTFPPAMSLLAMIGFAFGALAASGFLIAADRLPSDPDRPQPADAESEPAAPASKSPPQDRARREPVLAVIEKPLIARLQESDVMRTLGGILKTGGVPDVTRLGWPTLRAGFPLMSFLNAMREMRSVVARRSSGNAMAVVTVIGAGASVDRSIAALNIALAAARDGASVLMIDADHATHAISNKMGGLGRSQASRLGWLSIGTKASRAIKTANGISILPVSAGSDAKTSGARTSGAKASGTKASDAIRKAIAQARSAGGYDLVILDGPAMPFGAAGRKLIDIADGIVAILPANPDINEAMEDIITALDGAERKLVGVVLNELKPAAVERKRDKQYA
jgi:Mrp family chromosome partitioning ATPase